MWKPITYTGRTYSALLDPGTLILSLSCHGDGKLVDWRLDGAVDALVGETPRPDLPGTLVSVKTEENGEACDVTLALENGPWARKEIRLAFNPDYFTLQAAVTARGDRDQSVDTFRYGGYHTPTGPSRSLLNADLLWVWRPDAYEELITVPGPDVDVDLGSNEQSARYVIPPYAAAFRSPDAWWGVGTMGIPQAGTGLRVLLARGRRPAVELVFPVAGHIRVPAGETVEGPRVGFFVRRDRDSVLTAYREALTKAGLAPQPQQWETSWAAGPIYCTWGDQELTAKRHPKTNPFMYLTPDRVRQWLGVLEGHGIPYKSVILDSGWTSVVGDWFVAERLGGAEGLRTFVDELHARGKNVLLWFSPHWVASSAAIVERCPAGYLRSRDGEPVRTRGFYLFDYTHPEVRRHIASVLRFLLSDGPGCLNADGLKIDFLYDNPPLTCRYHDPAWGVGEKYSHAVQRLIYTTAKAVKGHSLIESSASNPLFQDVQDLCRLNDDYLPGENMLTYEMRARIHALACANGIDSDDWHAYTQFLLPLSIERAVFGVPALYSTDHRLAGRQAVAVDGADLRRVGAIFRAYGEAPYRLGQEISVNPEARRYARIETEGALAGFYRALALARSTALATYTNAKAVVVSTSDQWVAVPVPPGAQVLEVVVQRWDGTTAPAEARLESGTAHVRVPDAAGEFERCEVRYALPGGGGL